MPTVFCPHGHSYRWANRRGARLADERCPHCGEPVKRMTWRRCNECLGEQEFLVPVDQTHCPVGHAFPRAKRRMRVSGAHRYARKHLGPVGWAEGDYWLPEHLKSGDALQRYSVGVLATPIGGGRHPTRDEIGQGSILGRGRSFEDAFEDARANHPEAFLPQKGDSQ